MGREVEKERRGEERREERGGEERRRGGGERVGEGMEAKAVTE